MAIEKVGGVAVIRCVVRSPDLTTILLSGEVIRLFKAPDNT